MLVTAVFFQKESCFSFVVVLVSRVAFYYNKYNDYNRQIAARFAVSGFVEGRRIRWNRNCCGWKAKWKA